MFHFRYCLWSVTAATILDVGLEILGQCVDLIEYNGGISGRKKQSANSSDG